MLIKTSLKAYGKINLYLKVIKKLKNKYHEIESLFCFFNIYDQIFVSANRTYNQIIFTGKFSKGISNTNNTVLKLFNILKKYPKFNKHKFKIRIVKIYRKALDLAVVQQTFLYYLIFLINI